MSNERRHQDDLSDPLVSRTYRDLSDERTPAHLDHVVLNEARKAAKPGYVAMISWLRPAAWVTTIGLSLAIVLEVSDMAPPEQSVPSVPVTIEQEPEAPVKSVVATPAADSAATPPAAAKSPDISRSDTARAAKRESFAETGHDRPEADIGRVEAKLAEELPAAAPEPVNAEHQGPAALKVDSFDQDDRQMLRDAEKRARMQTGSNQESVDSLVQATPALGLASDAAVERYCEEADTADPTTWLACILELEQQGLLEAAKIERDLLEESFPDAEPPTLMGPPGE